MKFYYANHSRVRSQTYFHHLAQLIGDGEGVVHYENFIHYGDYCHNCEPRRSTIGREQKRIILAGKYWDTKTIKIAEKSV